MSGPDDDELLFADEGPDASAEAPAAQAPWVVLLVDDDPAVHMVSRLVFSPMRVDDRPLELLVTNSGEEGRKVLESRNDIAVAILDVVMETEEAGLNLARWIRTQSALNLTRIVLRTGQPGNAPEEEVLRLYDINDYWPKAELTAARARTLLTGQIRSFRDLQTIARQRADLETVLRSMSRLAEAHGVDGMTRDIFEQVSMLLGGHTPPMWLYDLVSVSAAPRDTWHAFGTSAAGAATTGPRWDLHSASLHASHATRRVYFADDHLALFHEASGEHGVGLVVDAAPPTDTWARNALEVALRWSLALLSARLLVEEQRALLTAVERFVPRRLVRMTGREAVQDVQPGDHRLSETWVVFADLRGFTTLSEGLGPSEIRRTLQSAFEAVTPPLLEGGGVIDKFLGDGFLALFPGAAPPPVEACRRALDCLDKLNVERNASGLPSLSMSMAIHGGPVLLCTLGDQDRIDITAISDTVNVCARLEAITRDYRCGLLVSSSVFEALSPEARASLRPLGSARVRGRVARVPVYDAERTSRQDLRAPAEALARAVALVEVGAVDEARAAVSALADAYPSDEVLHGLLALWVDPPPSSGNGGLR